MSLGCQVKCKPLAGHAGIHGNTDCRNHHQALSHWEAQGRYLPASMLTMASQEGGKGLGANGRTSA